MKIKLLITALLALTACNQNQTQNTHHHIVASDVAASGVVANPDIPIKVDLPIYLDGVPSLIHPVVVSAVSEHAAKSYSSEKISSEIYMDLASYQLSGEIFNLVFENKETGETKPLFSHNTQFIRQAQYLIYSYSDDEKNNSSKPLKRKLYRHFVYTVQERLDEKAPFHSERALYLSNEKGEQLQKLHSDKEFLLETRWLPEINRYYFTTKSDSNADGKITLADQTHNYYIDFSDVEKPVVKAYDVMPK